MKVTLFMAISLNGIVARENNEEDFLSHDNWKTFVELAHKTGCIIWGRKTHEVVRTWGEEYLKDIVGATKVVVSANNNFELEDGYIRAASPKDAVKKLENLGFKEALLAGGSGLNTSFAKERLIAEIILNIEPVLIGRGVHLFSPEEFDLKLTLIETEKITADIFQVHYKVL